MINTWTRGGGIQLVFEILTNAYRPLLLTGVNDKKWFLPQEGAYKMKFSSIERM